MTPTAAIPVFVASVAVMLAASAIFAARLDHVGLRLGLPETLLGLLTALAADAPELSSAIAALVQHEKTVAVGVVVGSNAFNIAAMLGLSAVVTGRVRARHGALELEAFVGLWILGVVCAVVAGGLGATLGLVLIALVLVPYVVLLPRAAHAPGEEHLRDRTLDSHRGSAQLALVLLAALCVIVAGSVGAVRSASDLADAWSVPQAFVGVFVLAILTSLPNAWTGVRFGLQGRGSALLSETLNSNSINVVAGLAVPAVLGSLGVLSGLTIFDLVWLLVMTGAALVLYGRRGGAGRHAGAFLILLYAAFVVVHVAAQT
jgi:cation:H+ antiporter